MDNFHETPNMYLNLNIPLDDQQQYMLKKINEFKDYFVAKIKERELMSKRLGKYKTKSLMVLSVTIGSISIASFATVVWARRKLHS